MASQSAAAARERPAGVSLLAGWLSNPLTEPVAVIFLALAVGVIGGLGAWVFRQLIHLFQLLFQNVILGSLLAPWAGYAGAAIVPALGLLTVSAIATYLAPEVKGHGVPQILEALALRGGHIRPIVAILGIVAPSITLGAGGSVGQEGPIALIGSSFGSVVGQGLRLREKHISLLLACGAAAGIAATFKAPIAGAFFGLEVILGSYAMGSVVPVFLSAVVGTVVFEQIVGSAPVLVVPTYGLRSPVEIVLAMVLGVLAGLAGLAYTRGLSFSESLFGRWQVPFWAKALSGGVAVGALGLAFPQVLGVGYDTMAQVVAGKIPLLLLVALFFAKYVATLTTIGAGGSGGVFAPSLYLGIVMGAIFGHLLQMALPQVVVNPAAYALVGMGAIFAASAQAPLTASLIILEMTGNYVITVGVMAACAVSYLVHGSLTPDSMYTVKLHRRGVYILRGTDVRPADRIPVASAMQPLERLGQGEGNPLPPGTAAARPPVTIRPEHSLDRAMRLFALYEVPWLLVEDKSGKPVGVLSQGDVLRAYAAHTLQSMEPSQRQSMLADRGEGEFRRFFVLPGSRLAGRRVADLQLPAEVVLVSIQRGGQTIAPHGDTILQADDAVLLFASSPVGWRQVAILFGRAPVEDLL